MALILKDGFSMQNDQLDAYTNCYMRPVAIDQKWHLNAENGRLHMGIYKSKENFDAGLAPFKIVNISVGRLAYLENFAMATTGAEDVRYFDRTVDIIDAYLLGLEDGEHGINWSEWETYTE